MSKIKNSGLDQYGAERFGRLILLYSQKNAGLKGLKRTTDESRPNIINLATNELIVIESIEFSQSQRISSRLVCS